MKEDGATGDPWCQHIPALHRALADERLRTLLPTLTDHRGPEDAAAAWEPLHYLLTVLLGWRSPGQGLLWWYRAGEPVDESPALACVAAHWSRNDLLDYYAAWAWCQNAPQTLSLDFSPSAIAKASIQDNEDWWRAFKRRSADAPRHTPCYGGSNPLHLGAVHSEVYGCESPDPDHCQLHYNTSTRRAVLIVNCMSSWRHDLRRAESRLPPLVHRSWQVDVFDRLVGHLGLFRRSRITGQWFVGRHSVHMRGNAQRVVA